jgi:hypothetical protein
MTDGHGVDSYLVCSTGHWLCFQQYMITKPFKDGEAGFGRFSVARIDDGSVAVTHIDTQGVFCDFLIPLRDTIGDCVVGFIDNVVLELHAEVAVGFSGKRKDHYAACNLIKAMDDPDLFELGFKFFNKIS